MSLTEVLAELASLRGELAESRSEAALLRAGQAALLAMREDSTVPPGTATSVRLDAEAVAGLSEGQKEQYETIDASSKAIYAAERALARDDKVQALLEKGESRPRSAAQHFRG